MNQNPEIWPHGVAYSVLKGSISTNKKIFIVYYRVEKGKKLKKMHVFFHFFAFFVSAAPLNLVRFQKKIGNFNNNKLVSSVFSFTFQNFSGMEHLKVAMQYLVFLVILVI